VPPELLHEIYSELALQQILEIEYRLTEIPLSIKIVIKSYNACA
jgi:hypothetical protein